MGSNGVEPFTSSLSEKRSTAELTAREPQYFNIFTCLCLQAGILVILAHWPRGRVVIQRSAKPRTPVRIRSRSLNKKTTKKAPNIRSFFNLIPKEWWGWRFIVYPSNTHPDDQIGILPF